MLPELAVPAPPEEDGGNEFTLRMRYAVGWKKATFWLGTIGVCGLLLGAVWHGPEKVSSVIEALGKLALEIGPVIAALVTIYNAIVLRQVHINTNSTLSEARAARDVALKAQEKAEAALLATELKQQQQQQQQQQQP